MSRLTLLILLLITLLCATPACTQEGIEATDESTAFPYARPEQVGLSARKIAAIDEEISKWVSSGNPVGAELLIVKDGMTVFHEVYGWSDIERRSEMQRDSIHSLKSMTKPVTALSVMMLEEAGKLSLDDRVVKYIPSFAGDKRATIRHLLAQTSGDDGKYAGGGFNIYEFHSLREWVDDWAGNAQSRAFGDYHYSNFNYAALGFIVESVSGLSADQFASKYILEPLQMTETFPEFTPDHPWAQRVNSRHEWNSDSEEYVRYWSNKDRQPWSFYPAALGLWGTAQDYAKFMTLWLNDGRYRGVRLLSEGRVDEALSIHGSLDGEGVYGYGWFVDTETTDGGMPATFRHGGNDGTVAVAYPADNAIVIYLTNSRGPLHLTALQNRIAMYGLFNHPGPSMLTVDKRRLSDFKLAPEWQKQLVGTYQGRTLSGQGIDKTTVQIWEENGQLILDIGEEGTLPNERFHLVPISNGQFSFGRYEGGVLKGIDSHVVVEFDMAGENVVRLVVSANGDVEIVADRVAP